MTYLITKHSFFIECSSLLKFMSNKLVMVLQYKDILTIFNTILINI